MAMAGCTGCMGCMALSSYSRDAVCTSRCQKSGVGKGPGGRNNGSYEKVQESVKFSAKAKQRSVLQALKKDDLAVYTSQRRNSEKRSITMIVDLISPLIEENYNDGE